MLIVELHNNYSGLVWPFVNHSSTMYNKFGLALSLLAVYEQYNRPHTPNLTSYKRLQITPIHTWLTAAIPLGSLIFCLHNLVSDPSTLIAWSWTGYKNGMPKGPVPHLHGSLTLIVQCLGLLLPIALSSSPTRTSSLLTHPLWLAFGAASSYVMYAYKDWAGYAGGLGVAFFLMSIVPGVLQRAAQTGRPAQTYGTAFGVYCVLNLASIFTVAYAFVPGGVYLRERTDWCVSCLQLLFLPFNCLLIVSICVAWSLRRLRDWRSRLSGPAWAVAGWRTASRALWRLTARP